MPKKGSKKSTNVDKTENIPEISKKRLRNKSATITPQGNLHIKYGDKHKKVSDLVNYHVNSSDQSTKIDDALNEYFRETKAKAAKKLDNNGPRELGIFDYKSINWERRLSTKFSLEVFNKTYLPSLFSLSWADYHIKVMEEIQKGVLVGGKFALAAPRGGGKTAHCRGGCLWALAHGHTSFSIYIGSKADKAKQSLRAIATLLANQPEIVQDFPEIAVPLKDLETRAGVMLSQYFLGNNTYTVSRVELLRLPCLLFPKELADFYKEHDQDSVIEATTHPGMYIPKAGGSLLKVFGIEGSIRGDAELHPVKLTQERPSVIILDDVQRDSKVDSIGALDKLKGIVEGAVGNTGGPTDKLFVGIPCTIMRDNDLASEVTDRALKPEFRGMRMPLVRSWPEGITDEAILDTTESSRLWIKYIELYREGLRYHNNTNEADALYAANLEVMNKNFEVAWNARIRPGELTAQQNAMNLRITNPRTFLEEFQQKPKRLANLSNLVYDPQIVLDRTVAYRRRDLFHNIEHLVGFIDVQSEVLFYVIFGCSPDYTGIICDYGTYPTINRKWYTKADFSHASLLSQNLIKKHPELISKTVKNTDGALRAPLEPKIYLAVSELVSVLLDRVFIRQDASKKRMKITKLGIDIRWGQVSNTLKQYISNSGFERILVPYSGQSISVTNKQLEEWQLTNGHYFEHQKHINLRECKWVIRPTPDGRFHMLGDADRLKDFTFERLCSPLGSVGSISLFQPEETESHELFAHHLMLSEYAEPVSARGLTKNQWKVRETGFSDNDFLDCLVGCMAMASLDGAYYPVEKPSN